MLSGWLLVIGIFVNGEVVPDYQYSSYKFKTKEQCEEVKSHPNVIGSYQDIVFNKYPDGELRIWCEPIKSK